MANNNDNSTQAQGVLGLTLGELLSTHFAPTPTPQVIIKESEPLEPPPPDEYGGIELAMRVTGWSASTIYTKTAPSNTSTIPVMALSGKHLRFSLRELEEWMRNGGDKPRKK